MSLFAGPSHETHVLLIFAELQFCSDSQALFTRLTEPEKSCPRALEMETGAKM